MDSDYFQADLNALRKLYRLLQINTSCEQSAVSEILDEGSRIFLKKLLDGAAERIFEDHIKIMADNWRSVLGIKSLGQLEKAKESETLQRVAKSSDFDQNIKESVVALLQKDYQPLKMPNRVPSVTSQIRRFTSELQSRIKKRCLTCEQSNKLEETIKTPAAKESVSSSANRTTPKKEVEDGASKVQDFSKKIDDAIARIESLIPSLHNMSKPVSAPSPPGQTGGVVTKTKQSQTRQSNQVQYSPRKHRQSSDRSAQGNYLPQLNESEETSSDSSGSSSWNTVEGSSSSSLSDTTTQTSTTRCSGENDSEFSSNSLDYSDADFEPSKTRHVTSQSMSRDDSSSNSASDSGDDDLSPSENYQSKHRSIRQKKEGKFQRLKNKLGLNFHHHHHHHHHHPHDKSAEPSKSVWNKAGKLFKGTEKKAEAKVGKKFKNKEKKVGPKKVASGRKGKKQIGHFHAILRGLMRHVRHSRRPKLGGQRRTKPNLRLNRIKLAHKPRMKLLARKNKKPRLRLK